MKTPIIIIMAAAGGLVYAGLACDCEKEGADMDMTIFSNAFTDGGTIPVKYTGQGNDISPPLNWSRAPEDTVSFVLIGDDPDAPDGTWVHWIVFNIPGNCRGLDEGASPSGLAPGAVEGANDFGKTAYGGPMPPPGTPHRYFFKIYALDTMLDLQQGATKEQVEAAMEGHILANTHIIGLYER